MSLALRPMSLGEILDRTFQIYKARFWVLAGISAFPAALMLCLHLADTYWWGVERRIERSAGGNQWGTYALALLFSLAFFHVAMVVHSVFTPAILKQASDSVLAEPGTLRGSLRFALSRWRSFLWIGFIGLAVVLVAPELAALGAFIGAGFGLDALGLLTGDKFLPFVFLLVFPSFMLVGLFLWMTGCCGFMLASCAFEGVRGFKALKRSWGLSREARWRVALTYALLLLGLTTLSGALQMGFRSVVMLAYRSWTISHHFLNVAYVPASYALFAVYSAAAGSVYPIAITLLYYDQRIRKEGFDIEWMMQAAGMDAPLPADTAASETASVAAEETGA